MLNVQVKERLSVGDLDALMPQDMTAQRLKPISSPVVKEFFGSGSQLCAVLVDSRITRRQSFTLQTRRISHFSPWWSDLREREKASESSRSYTQPTMVVCPIETPEGPNIGHD